MDSSVDNYVAALLRGIGADPQRVVVRQPDGSTMTAAELTDLVHRTAHVLRERGVRQGSTVSILSGNRAEAQTTRYAANLLGARTVPLYEDATASTLAVIAAEVETDVLVTDPRHAPIAARIAARVPVKTVLSFGPATTGADLLALAATAPATPVEPHPVRAEDIWSVRYTAGTAGRPKGILMPFGPYTRIVTDPARPKAPGVMLVCTTLAHGAGLMADGALYGGGSLVLHDGFDPVKVLADIERRRGNSLWLLPRLVYQLTEQQASAPVDTSSLFAVIYGGTASSPARMAQAVREFGPVFLQIYGQTEAALVSVLLPGDHERPDLLGTAGRVMPGVEIRIVDANANELPSGESGEICVRAHTGAVSYLNNTELTAQVWRDGWVHTGDIGSLDGDGILRVNDRIKDMIKVAGAHVYPAEVEAALSRHPAIADAAVFGVWNEDRTEQVHAALVPQPGATIELEAVRAHVTTQMGARYTPSAITILDAIPLTDAGKPNKRLLRDQVRRSSLAIPTPSLTPIRAGASSPNTGQKTMACRSGTQA